MRTCECGHTHSQHELRADLFGCYISGCLCVDFVATKPTETFETECYGCLAVFDGYPRPNGPIQCPKCGSYEVHLAEAHDNWKANR